MEDKDVLRHIEDLIAEEQRLYHEESPGAKERSRLHHLQVELDRYWDLLRQRRALRDAGKNPNNARLRGPDIVENYEQ